MIVNQDYVNFRVKNGGSYDAFVRIIYTFDKKVTQITAPRLRPNTLFNGKIPKGSIKILFTVRNLSLSGHPIFCEECIDYAVETCFLLEGTSTTAICIPIPCSSFNQKCNIVNCCNYK